MTNAEAVKELRFGSRLSVFLRSLNVLKLISDLFGGAETKEALQQNIMRILDAAALGAKLTPGSGDDSAITWLRNALANESLMAVIWYVYSTFVKPQPEFNTEENVYGGSSLISEADLNAALDKYAAA